MVGNNGGGLCGCGGGHCLGERVVRGRSRRVGKGRHPRVGRDLTHAVWCEWCLGGQWRHHRLQGKEAPTSEREQLVLMATQHSYHHL